MNFLEDSELLFEGRHSFIYLKKGKPDSTPMIIKVLKEDYPTPQHILQFNNEYEITQALNIVGIRKALEKIQLESGQFALRLKYVEGISLKEFAKTKPIPIEAFLIIAIQLTQTLHLLHDQNIIHKDLNSNNIIIEPVSLKATIIDFGISSKVGLKTPYTSSPDRLEGTLTYISPEQTGRMNRKIDYRTDLYSLGVTFYELLTGKLPFTHSNPVKLIHQHLAFIPNPPHFIRTGIPYQISEIVLKLMSKNAESRYQSAFGLQKDLEKCLFQLQKNKPIEIFELADNDLPNKFNISEKLYSRETAINQLLESFRFMNEGNSKLVLITGNAGIGKSTLVTQLHEPIIGKEGIFVTGKFDQFQSNIPYFAFIQAIEEFIDQILTESEKNLERRKKDILRAVGNTGEILTTLIPKLKLIIGEPVKVGSSEGKEAQNRLHYAFSRLIKAIAKKRHPFVMFIDDLQWADKSSLYLLEYLIRQENIPYLMFIGAYRPSEVNALHPFNDTLKVIKNSTFSFEEIQLSPLKIKDIEQLIADTLFTTTKECHTLAELVYRKTNGNPFFTIQFLESLYEEGLLRFKVSQDSLLSNDDKQIQYKWEWNMAAIRQRNITDNVVRLLTEKIRKLLPETQQILQLASCIGNRFDLELLSLVYEHSPAQTTEVLRQTLEEGLIVPLIEVYQYITDDQQIQDIEYKFTHDQIRKAVYNLIPLPYQKNIHWKIGSILQKRNISSQKPQQIFEIVQQLNKAIDMVDSEDKKIKLIRLNFQAGKQAKESAAFGLAYQYFDTALSLLPKNSWQNHYRMSLGLHNHKAEAAYLSGNIEESHRIIEVIFANAQSTLDKSRAWKTKLFLHKAKGEIEKTIQVGIEALANLDVHISLNNSRYTVFWELTKTNLLLKQYSSSKIEALPLMDNRKYLAVTELLEEMLSAVYIYGNNLFPIVISKIINISLKNGLNSAFPIALLSYASLYINIRGKIPKGYNYGKTALALNDKIPKEKTKTKISTVYHLFIHHWQNSLHSSLLHLSESYKRFLVLGDFEFAGISIASYTGYALFSDKHLGNITKEVTPYYETVKTLKVANPIHRMQLYLQFVHNLSNNVNYPTKLSGSFFEEETTLSILESNKNYYALFLYYCFKLILAYLFGDFKTALKYVQAFEQFQAGSNGMFSYQVFYTYDALAYLAAYSDLTKQEQIAALTHVKSIQKKIRSWKKHAPTNHEHRWHLIEAEYCRVTHKTKKALKHYQKAILIAQENGFISFEAIGNELLAKYYLSQNENNFAEFYLQKALFKYQQWGAVSKAERLINDYPEFLARIIYSPTTTSSYSLSSLGYKNNSSQSYDSTSNRLFDAYGLLKISQELLSEIVLPRLIEKILIHSLETIGAQKAYLMLVNDKRISIEAKLKISNLNKEEKSAEFLASIPLKKLEDEISHTIVNYVMRTQNPLMLDNAQQEERFKKNTYIIKNKVLSVFCLPILQKGKITSLLYFENNLTSNAFSRDQLSIMKALSTQFGIALNNAQLYHTLIIQNKEQQRANENLYSQNKDLQQFTYITSHNLREPVSNLLGLLELYNYKELDDPINQIVVNGFKEVSTNMDTMLRDLSRVITSKNKVKPPKEAIIFVETLRHIQQNLKTQIQTQNTKINQHIEVDSIFSIKSYIHSIFYNLISNALKYRSPKRDLIIDIHIRLFNPDTIHISVIDNGMGIDLELNNDNLFGIYTRFHPQIEGKGLGLHLIKSHIENINGRIEVESEVDKGTTFHIYLPT